MKKLLLLLLLISSSVFSQKKYLELKNNETGKVHKITENKKVKIITNDNSYYIGRVQFVDSATVKIKENYIKLEDIDVISRKSVGKAIVGNSLVVLGWVALTGSAVAIIALEPVLAIVAFSTGLTVGITGKILLSNTNKNYYREKWTYKIIYL